MNLLLRRNRMTARDIRENHRVSTPLELFFDLIYVIAVATAVSGLHHALSEGHTAFGINTYLQMFFFLWWAWMNFTWFASAYDTDDSYYRILTMVQMFGALVFAVGINSFFSGANTSSLGLFGFIIMRIVMVFQWLRAAKGDPKNRTTCLKYAIGIAAVQCGWVIFNIYPNTPCLLFILIAIEISIPAWAEGKTPSTTWHPHHIAERYGLLFIIVLGESLTGISSTVKKLVEAHANWFTIMLPLGLGIISIIFVLWWIYFQTPWGNILHKQRTSKTAFLFGYGHYFLFAAIAAVGAGIELVADVVGQTHAAAHAEHAHHISTPLAIGTLSVSIGIFLLFNSLIKIVILGKDRYLGYGLLIAVATALIPIALAYAGISILVLLFTLLIGVLAYLWANSWHLCHRTHGGA